MSSTYQIQIFSGNNSPIVVELSEEIVFWNADAKAAVQAALDEAGFGVDLSQATVTNTSSKTSFVDGSPMFGTNEGGEARRPRKLTSAGNPYHFQLSISPQKMAFGLETDEIKIQWGNHTYELGFSSDIERLFNDMVNRITILEQKVEALNNAGGVVHPELETADIKVETAVGETDEDGFEAIEF